MLSAEKKLRFAALMLLFVFESKRVMVHFICAVCESLSMHAVCGARCAWLYRYNAKTHKVRLSNPPTAAFLSRVASQKTKYTARAESEQEVDPAGSRTIC
jgi:hypothetical protein